MSEQKEQQSNETNIASDNSMSGWMQVGNLAQYGAERLGKFQKIQEDEALDNNLEAMIDGINNKTGFSNLQTFCKKNKITLEVAPRADGSIEFTMTSQNLPTQSITYRNKKESSFGPFRYQSLSMAVHDAEIAREALLSTIGKSPSWLYGNTHFYYEGHRIVFAEKKGVVNTFLFEPSEPDLKGNIGGIVDIAPYANDKSAFLNYINGEYIKMRNKR